MLKIAVCIKQVPQIQEKIDKETGCMIRSSEGTLNMYDYAALEWALQLKDSVGAQVKVFTMGPSNAEKILREALSMGADDAYLVSDNKFAGADVLATSYTLSKAIKYVDAFDLIICGKQTTDGDTAQVAGEIAGHMNLSYLPWVTNVEYKNNRLYTWIDMEEREYYFEVKLPCVLSILPTSVVPRIPTLMNVVKSRRKQIPLIDAEKGKMNLYKIGKNGSPTQVTKIEKKAVKKDINLIEIDASDAKAFIEHSILEGGN